MNRNTDPRVTAKSMGIKEYILLFLVLLVVCGSYTGIYFLQISANRETNGTYIFLSMVTYLVIISVLFTAIVAFLRKRFFHKPIDALSAAARRVAAGDYSVRLAPKHDRDHRDELDVLFEDFNTMAEGLQSTELLKKDFISNVSHEMKTPLAVMQNYATILQSDGLSDEEKREYAAKIADASERLSTMVTNILQLSRLENQKTVIQKAPYNLSEQLSRCAVGFEDVWEEKDIELCAELDQNLILTSDEELLDIVWNNLIANALKFTESGGTVTISALSEGGSAAVTVRDTGCGIDENALAHIFDKFYQADTSHATKGNGLGLALVKNILDLLGGDVSVESAPGVGTSFTVRIPLAEEKVSS